MNSLLSVITTLYALALLYSPSIISRLILSPVPLSTLILLLFLLQLGAAQRSTIKSTDSIPNFVELTQPLPQRTEEFRDSDCKPESDECSAVIECKHCRSYKSVPKQNPSEFYSELFVEWDVRAPLEVIYEEYEGEDAEENDSEAKRELQLNVIRRYASLSLFYPDSDSDTSSEGDFSADRRWEEEEEDDREGLIEIALDEKRHGEVEEENLIEIDLSPAR